MASILGEKSLITSTSEGRVKVNNVVHIIFVFIFKKISKMVPKPSCTSAGVDLPRSSYERTEPGPRRQWASEAPDTVLQMLAGASLVSSDSVASVQHTDSLQGSTIAAAF